MHLLGVGSPSGMQAGDSFAVGGVLYTAGTTFALVTNLLPARNTANTLQNIIQAVNTKANAGISTVRAFSAAAVNEASGKILFEGLGASGNPFYFSASRTASWNPTPPNFFTVVAASSARVASTVTITTAAAYDFVAGNSVLLGNVAGIGADDVNFPGGIKVVVSTPTPTTFTYTEAGAAATLSGAVPYGVSGITTVSSNDTAVNRIYYSKYQEPEAVPLLNYVSVGSKSSAILRIIPSNERLYVLKEDSIYTVSGQYPDFRVDLLDNTIRLLAPDTAALVNGKIYALTNQGVVAISEAGISIVSRPIDAELSKTFFRGLAAGNTALSPAAWGTAYNSEHWYLMGAFSSSVNTSSQIIYVYNVITGVWTKWLQPRLFGIVEPSTDRLWFSDPNSPRCALERKGFTYTDYADTGDNSVVVAVDATNRTVTMDAPGDVFVGDVIGNGTSTGVLITSIANSPVVSYALGGVPPSVGNTLTFRGFQVTLEYAPQFAGSPGTSKQFKEVTYHFNNANFSTLSATFRTDLDTVASTASFFTPGYATSKNPLEFLNERLLVPLEKQRGALCRIGISSKEAWSSWQLAGYSLEIDGVSNRNVR